MKKGLLGLVVALIAVSVIGWGAIVPPSTSAQQHELVIWVRDDHTIDFKTIIGTFQQNYNFKIRIESKPYTEIRDTFVEAVASGKGPDIFTGSDDWLWRYWDDELLAPIDLGPKMADFVPFATAVLMHNGQLYGVPYGLENTAFVRNLDLVPDPPQTWADVQEIAQQIVESKRADYGFALPDNDWYVHYPVQAAFGGYMFGQRPDGTFDKDDIGLNNEGAVAGLVWMRHMIEQGLMPVGLDWGQTYDAFASGQAAMTIIPVGLVRSLDASSIHYAVSAIPAGTQPGSSWLYSQAFFVNARSPHLVAALAFVRDYSATDQAMRMISHDTRLVSAHMTVFEETRDPVLLGFAEAMMTGQQYPNIPEAELIWGIYVETVQQIKEGRAEPQAALDKAVAVIQEQIK